MRRHAAPNSSCESAQPICHRIYLRAPPKPGTAKKATRAEEKEGKKREQKKRVAPPEPERKRNAGTSRPEKHRHCVHTRSHQKNRTQTHSCANMNDTKT